MREVNHVNSFPARRAKQCVNLSIVRQIPRVLFPNQMKVVRWLLGHLSFFSFA